MSVFGKNIKNDEKQESKWSRFWRNKRHNQIYYFSSAVLALVIAFSINLVSISAIYNEGVTTRFANTTVFTPSTVTTLSGVPIQVMLCRINEAKNQMFMLLKISDMTNISLDISNYELFITNVDKNMQYDSKPEENLKGQYYMFGATGYAGIYIYTDDGTFSDVYKWITVRNYNPVTNNRQPHVAIMQEDYQYDQYHLYINPHSQSAQSIDFLESHDIGTPLDSVQIYKEAISENLEAEIKNEITATLTKLEDVRIHIIEYRRRLAQDYGLAVPDVAPIMSGDSIETVELTDSDGNVIETRRQFDFAGVVPGGVDLDWRGLSLRTGYYQSFYESNVYSLSEFISDTRAESKSKTSEKITVMPTDWTFSADGSKVDVALSDMEPIVKEIGIYNKYLTEYVSLKTKVQADLFVSLLELEYTTNTYMMSARILTDRTSEDGTVIPALRKW